MKVFFDLNIVLDLLLDRAPWSDEAKPLLARVLDGRIQGFVSATSIPTLYYISRKTVGTAGALLVVRRCLQAFDIAPVGRAALEAALQFGGPDFEDNVQAASAAGIGADAIVTRDPAGFVASPVPASDPISLLARLGPSLPP